VRSEGDMSLKNAATQPGIDPGTVRLVAQRLNHYATPGSKAAPLQACSGPEGSRKLRFPDFMTMVQDGGKVVSLGIVGSSPYSPRYQDEG
jgi:hypothetical protein